MAFVTADFGRGMTKRVGGAASRAIAGKSRLWAAALATRTPSCTPAPPTKDQYQRLSSQRTIHIAKTLCCELNARHPTASKTPPSPLPIPSRPAPQAIGEALLRLLTDPSLWEACAAGGRGRVNAYSWSSHCVRALCALEQEKVRAGPPVLFPGVPAAGVCRAGHCVSGALAWVAPADARAQPPFILPSRETATATPRRPRANRTAHF